MQFKPVVFSVRKRVWDFAKLAGSLPHTLSVSCLSKNAVNVGGRMCLTPAISRIRYSSCAAYKVCPPMMLFR